MRPPWLVIGLVAYVALNLFLIGAAAGVIALGVRMAREGPGPRPGAFVRATRDLPEPDKRNFRQMLRGAWAQTQPAAEQSRRLRLEAWTALTDPKADAAVIKLELAQSRQLDLASRARVEEKIVDYVLTLPPADRARFVAGMQRVLTPPGPPPAAPPPATTKTPTNSLPP